MRKSFGLSALAGLASGALFLSMLVGGGFGVLLVYLAPLPLMVVGLCYGLSHAAAGSVVGALTVGALSLALTPVYAAVAAGSALIVVRQALLWRQLPDGSVEWMPPGGILTALTSVAVVLLSGWLAYLATGEAGIAGAIRGYVTAFVDGMAGDAQPDVKEGLVALWGALLPASAAGGWLMVAVLNGVLGQWLAVRSGHQIRPTPGYVDLDVPPWIAGALGLAVAGVLVGSPDVAYAARNIASVLLLPLVLLGLATTHANLRSRQNGKAWLVVFYLCSVLLFGWAVLGLAVLGLIKLWTRRRRQEPGRGQEEE